MDTFNILALIILTTACRVVNLTSTWENLMHLESAQDGYIHRILIGSNSQKFDVMVTMSSSMLWVPKVGCKGSGSRKTYIPSPSFERDGRNWTQKSYGGTINGELGIDDVTIRDFLKSRSNFGLATTISTDTELPVDGVLGLAPIADSSTPSQPFITQIKGLLTAHMFTIYLSQHSGSNAGSVTYGSANNDNCLTTGSTQAFTNAYYIRISSISLGNFTHTYMNYAAPELIPSITGPQADIDGLAKAAAATPGSYEVRCNATFPKLEIKVGRRTYSIRSNRLIVEMGNKCVLALASQTGGGFGPQWHFGAPLLQEYCITFNLKTNNLEFFGVKSGPTTNSTTRRTTSTSKKNTTSTPKTTRRIPTSTPRKTSTSTRKTTRRMISTTSKIATTSRPRTTRRVLSTTARRNITTTRRFTTTPVRTTTKLARTSYLYCLFSFMLFSTFLTFFM